MATPSRCYDGANVGGCDADHDRPFVGHGWNPTRRVETLSCTLMIVSLPPAVAARPRSLHSIQTVSVASMRLSPVRAVEYAGP
jgi:hypothetical protein